MKHAKFWAVVPAVVLLSAATSFGQYKLAITFRGTAYLTNGTGNVVAVPLTEQTFVQDAAQRGGVDPSTLTLVYHIGGSSSPPGDSIDVVNASNGSTGFVPFEFLFGDNQDDPTLGRSSLTNATHTEVRRVDYLYTLNPSTYTSPNNHSMGAAFVTKRYVTDTGGTVHVTIEGPMHWIANPQGTNGPIICNGSFTTGRVLF